MFPLLMLLRHVMWIGAVDSRCLIGACHLFADYASFVAYCMTRHLFVQHEERGMVTGGPTKGVCILAICVALVT